MWGLAPAWVKYRYEGLMLTGRVEPEAAVAAFSYRGVAAHSIPSRGGRLRRPGWGVFWASAMAELSPEKAGSAVFHHFYIFLILFIELWKTSVSLYWHAFQRFFFWFK